MDSLTITLDSLQVIRSPVNSTVTTLNNFSDWIQIVSIHGFNIALLVAFLYVAVKLAIKLNKKNSSIDKELSENTKDYLTMFMTLSSIGAITLFSLAAAERGVFISSALIRFTIIGFVEMTAYFFFTKAIVEYLSISTKHPSAIAGPVFTLVIGILFTIVMHLSYYESIGAITFVFDGGIFPSIVGGNGTQIDFSAIFLIWSTPIFAIWINYIAYEEQSKRKKIIEIQVQEEKKKKEEKEENKNVSIIPVEKKKKTQ